MLLGAHVAHKAGNPLGKIGHGGGNARPAGAAILQAAQAIGEVDEARVAYKRALALEPYDQETDAAELLEEMDDEEEDD